MKRRLFLGLAAVGILLGCRGSESGDRLRYGISRLPESLDPIALRHREDSLVAAQIFEGLVRFLPDEAGVIPCLASRWEISRDARSYQFILRQGIVFHDGTAMDSEAVRFSLDRLIRAERPEPPPESPVAWAFLDHIQSVEALDPVTVRITLTHPYSPFLKDLARPCSGIVSPAAAEAGGGDFGRNPVGTGPFRFAGKRDQDSVVLERWGGYWEMGALPRSVEFRALGDEDKRVVALEAGEIHLTDINDLGALSRSAVEGGSTLHRTMGTMVVGLALDCTKAPLSSLLVRRAVAHSLDKENLARQLFAESGEVAHGVLTSTMWGYRERPEVFAHDAERARALLAEAGYPGGFETTLRVSEAAQPLPNARELAEAIRKDLETVGIVARMESSRTPATPAAPREDLPTMSLQLLDSPNGDADGFLARFAGGADETPCGSPAADHIFALVRETTDGQERQSYYAQLDEVVVQDVPWVFIAHLYQMTLADSAVTQFRPHPTGLHLFKDVKLE